VVRRPFTITVSVTAAVPVVPSSAVCLTAIRSHAPEIVTGYDLVAITRIAQAWILSWPVLQVGRQ
jgi:hypothetical protein